MFDIDLRIAEAKIIADTLLKSQKYDFDGLKPSDLKSGLPVVYAIFNKESGKCLYVGRTKNLRQRLYTNHLMGNKSSARLKKYLEEDASLSDVTDPQKAKDYLIKRCCFSYLHVKNMRKRGQIEGLLSFLLNVRYIHEEH